MKNCTITAGIKKCISIIKKKKKRHDKIVLLAKSKLNEIKLLFSNTLINSDISHDKFVLKNNVLNKYDEMKEETRNLKA